MSNILGDISEWNIEWGDHIEEGSRSSSLMGTSRNLFLGILAATTLSGCALRVIPTSGYDNYWDYDRRNYDRRNYNYHPHRKEPAIIIIQQQPPPRRWENMPHDNGKHKHWPRWLHRRGSSQD